MQLRKRQLRYDEDTELEEKKNRFRRRVVRTIKQADVFQKAESEHETQTEIGGMLSVISLVIISFLLIAESRRYLTVDVSEHISVDTRTDPTWTVELDMTLFALRCTEVHVDVMDVSGEQQLDIFDGPSGSTISRARLAPDGTAIGKPYEHSRFNEIQDEAGEGCHLYGNLTVNRVKGNLHIAIGRGAAKNGRHFHQFSMSQVNRNDL